MSRTPTSRARNERGIATVVALGLMGVLLAVTAIAVAGTVVSVTGHRAGSAADLAALAGAQAMRNGGVACAAAAQMARRNSATLSKCSVSGLDVQVTVRVSTPSMIGLAWSVPGSARAGPGGSGEP